MIDLTGGHVIVVGGSRGIGAGAALYAARAGANVTIIYRRNDAAAEDMERAIGSTGAECFLVRADAANESEIAQAVASGVSALGRPTGAVISAGIFEGVAVEEMTANFWDRTMAINLRSTFLAVREISKRMREGSIVIYTSTAGQRGSAIHSAYAASKAGQIMFMRSMAKELGPRNIRVNCIAPAWTETDLADESLTRLGREKVAQEFVLGRIGTPEDVAGPTVFLLSDLARFITGSTITVDGGMDMRG